MSIIEISSILTLKQLYKKGTLLKPKTVPLYSPSSSLLDRVALLQGDLTKVAADAIVNAANETLLGGGGVDGAIHRAAGPQLLEECETLHGAETGQAKITKGYNLPAKHVIHTVGPIYSSSRVETVSKQLASCYRNSLKLAIDNSLSSIAFCCVSTGVYEYPITDATHIALKETRQFLESPENEMARPMCSKTLTKLIFVVWNDRDRDVYYEFLPLYFPFDE
ncbi:A1pp-domain-containing protein [Hysterangium stoloniferum]|nr:A1pp-domain-containing protein [Hysterangium stoloniferum]